MNTRDIVRKAWQITQVHLKKLIWYGAIPSFFTIVVSSIYLAYQYHAFKTSVFFGAHGSADVLGTAKTLWGVVTSHPTFSIVLIVLSFFFFLGYTLVPPIFNGTLIHALTKISKYESIEGSMEVGVRRFFPMFEFGLLTGAFGITTLFTESSFILRWWGESIFFITLPFLLFIAIVGFIISFLFAYAEFFIVLHNKKLIKSIMESTILVISNLRKTFLVFVLMILISVRIILNVVLVLLVPMLMILATSYFANTFWSILGAILIGLFGLGVLLVSSYLFGLFHIFAVTVWVLTFNLLTLHSESEKATIRDEEWEGSEEKA